MYTKKQVYRLFVIPLAMIMLLISCAGCGQRYKIEEGFLYSFELWPIMMGMRSKTDTFPEDDVTFELHYSFYEFDDNPPYAPYALEVWDESQNYGYYLDDEQIIFCLYIYNTQDRNKQDKDFGYLSEVSDYKALEHYTFIKEISHEEAFSGEYSYTNDFLTGLQHNHSEMITIPQEVLNVEVGEQGAFYIEIIAFQTIPKAESNSYRFTYSGEMLFEYEVINEQTIRITKVDYFL